MDRTVRIAAEMQRVLSDIIRDMKDPRIPIMTSVMDIKLAKDLKYAKVYISIYGTPEEKAACMTCLKNSSGFIRREIGRRMIIRSLPELNFALDESIEKGADMMRFIDQVVKNDEKKLEETN